jgi:hypothetical protein
MSTIVPLHAAPAVSRDTLDNTRVAVRDLLARSPAFAQLAPATQRQMAHDLVQVSSYMAEPGMKVAPGQAAPEVQALATNGLFGLPGLGGSSNTGQASGSTKLEQVSESGAPKFGQAAAAGVDQAIRLIQGVNFPGFVSGLINGVFHSIVTSSIEQMEAYAKLVADVSKSIDQFRDDNTTPNQGRDHLVDQFGDLFKMQMPGQGDFDDFGSDDAPKGPRVVLRDGVDEGAAVQRLNASGLPLAKPLTGLDNDTIEALLVPAARTTIATGRQQLLATMVMMGINRIVVTDGKIQAKVMFDFQAKDSRKFAKSAVSYDYATDAYGNVQQSNASSGDYDYKSDGGSTTYDSGNPTQVTGASSYSKGTYKYDQTPIVTLTSTSQLRDDSSLQTKATLSGLVEVNFKSDYLPLEKMADPAAIAAIQMNAQPGMVKSIAGRTGAGGAGGGRGTGGATAMPAAAPAPAPAAAPAA